MGMAVKGWGQEAEFSERFCYLQSNALVLKMF